MALDVRDAHRCDPRSWSAAHRGSDDGVNGLHAISGNDAPVAAEERIQRLITGIDAQRLAPERRELAGCRDDDDVVEPDAARSPRR